MPIKSFTDLQVWQRAMDLVTDVYRVTGAYPRNERFVLAAQSRRAAISIPSNIAEGFCRRSPASYANHLTIALGSQAELFTQLEIARRLGFLSDTDHTRVVQDLAEVERMIRGLWKALQPHIRKP